MRKARALVEDAVLPNKSKTAKSRSDARLRRLLTEAGHATDPRKKAQLKEEFIREFYEGAG